MDIASALKQELGVRASSDAADRVAYSRDLWPKNLLDIRRGRVAEHQPQAIVWPETSKQARDVVRFAYQEGIPLVPFGAGSGVCGAVLPEPASIILDVKQLKHWSIDEGAPLLNVGAGALGVTLEEDLAHRGYSVGHFPSSILCSTVGGWVAARGAGQCSGLYGKIEDMVVGLEVITGRGELLELSRRRHGPNLIPLLIGSEGTLGVITRAKLRLHRAPSARAFLAFEFSSTETGWDALRQLFQAGLRPAVSRLYDPVDSFFLKQGAVKSPKAEKELQPRQADTGRGLKRSLLGNLLNKPRLLGQLIRATEGNLLGGATLILIFEGEAEHVSQDAERARQICQKLQGISLGEGPARHWLEHRYSVSYRQAPVFRLGAFSDTMEVSAPWAKLEQLYQAVRSALSPHVLVMAHLSHAYPDGCSIYFTFSGIEKNDERALEKYDAAWRDALSAAIQAGGSLSHHHGVGRSKAPKLGQELGYGVELVRRLQASFDPEGILNPGNLLPRSEQRYDESDALAEARWPLGIDELSQLGTFDGASPLKAIFAQLERTELRLALGGEIDLEQPLSNFIAEGMPGTRNPYEDPVEQRLAGFVAELPDGNQLGVRPAPRRAVGPDLSALVLGMQGRCMRVKQATLCLTQRDLRTTSRSLPFNFPEDPAPTDAERQLIHRVAEGVLHPSS